MSIGDRSLEAQELLGRLREETASTEEKDRLLVAMDALKFIAATGQSREFDAYRQSLNARAPPLVIASFDTREAADAWLKQHPSPPLHAYVLIAGEYHVVMHVPESNHRRLISHPVLEFYLADLLREGLPAPEASFHTREEADAWLHAAPEPPRQTVLQIAGEPHLAVYHHRVGLRALYPFSRAAKPETQGEAGH